MIEIIQTARSIISVTHLQKTGTSVLPYVFILREGYLGKINGGKGDQKQDKRGDYSVCRYHLGKAHKSEGWMEKGEGSLCSVLSALKFEK